MSGCILVRHGKKKWNNGARRCNGCPFDPPLLNGNDVRRLNLTGFQRIICSPFLRCRETALILSGGQIPVFVDPNLREYLGNWQGRNVSVLPETQTYIQEHLVETFDQFKERVLRTLNSDYYQAGTVVVTHGLVIKVLCEKLGMHVDPKEAEAVHLTVSN